MTNSIAEKRKYSTSILMEHLLDSIPTSSEKSFEITQLMDRLDLVEGSKEYLATRKAINRILAKWVKEYEFEFRKEPVGRENKYHWVSKEARDSHFGRFSSEEMAESQAIAFHLLDSHIAEMLPPKFKRELRNRFNIANNQVIDSTEWINPLEDWRDKLVIEPLGFPLHSLPIDETEYAKVFDALEHGQILQGEYESIHQEINNKGQMVENTQLSTITFSPQQIRLQNLQLSVLVIVHAENEANCFKTISLARLKNVQAYTGVNFKYVHEKQNSFTERLKIRAHKGLKNYFEQVKLGSNQIITHEEGDSWLVEATIKLPQHFKNEGPDLFYLCNLLSSYANSVEVIEPLYIRKEMKRRAEKLSRMYTTDSSDNSVINEFNQQVLNHQVEEVK